MADVATLTPWERALRDPALQDLPYKIETNKRGQLILSPHTLHHSRWQGRIQSLLRDLVDAPGEQPPEFPVQTSEGVKVVGVAWISAERLQEIPSDAAASPVAPEICVEVLSASNTPEEMAGKRRLYVERGAEEVWTYDPASGAVTFHDADGPRDQSARVPDFPSQIDPPST